MNQKADRIEPKGMNLGGICDRCRKVLTQIARSRAAVLAEWSDALKPQQHALRLALNEAEALAWQTMYPHLVFPVLATEKVQAVAAWNSRQQRLWWNTPTENR
jgi:hypothetical protein